MDPEKEVEAKVRLIEGGLAEGLFGHIVITSAFWGQLEGYFNRYFPLFATSNVEEKVIKRLEWVLLSHPLHKFPVASPHLVSVIEWLQNSLEQYATTMTFSQEVTSLAHLHTGAREPTFIFKSLNRNTVLDATVTLFEENEIIGHGTTGYTSWQGALFATDWLLSNFEDKLKVNFELLPFVMKFNEITAFRIPGF